jgi:uncharacterized protein YhfF
MTELRSLFPLPPGELLDRLAAEVAAGTKTATSAPADLFAAQGYHPAVGDRLAVHDSAGTQLAVVELTGVDVYPMREATDAIAVAEGTSFTDAESFIVRHLDAFNGRLEATRAALGDPEWVADRDTRVITRWFRLVADA